MKTSLGFLSLSSAASLPAAFGLSLAGVSSAAAAAVPPLLGAFVISCLLLAAWADYAPTQYSWRRHLPATATRPILVAPGEKAAHPLAA